MSTLPEELQQAEGPWLPRAFTTAAKHYQAGFFDEARQLLVRILELEPRHADSMYLMASIAGQSGDLDLAEELLKQAIAIEPGKALFWVLLGNVMQRRERLEDSAECYQKAIEADPASADAYYNWGNTLDRQGKKQEATRAFVKTLALQHDHLEARVNLANQYRDAGRIDEAEKLLELARRQQPQAVPVLMNLGNIYMLQRRYPEALECFTQALETAPNSAMLYNNKGNALRAMGRIEEALAAFGDAIGREPQRAELWVNRGNALQQQGRLPEALQSYRQALDFSPTHAAAHGAALFTLHYDPAAGTESLLEEHRLWGDRHAASLHPGARAYHNACDPEKRLRIGYVSPDFRRHPISYFLAPVLEKHAAHAFCYWTGSHPDQWTERLKKSGAVWRDVPGFSDQELAAQVEADQIDILVDLSGHTSGNRLLMFARRPAPVQVSWLGYFNTTGMKAMDYLLVDRVLAPESETPPFVEQPLRVDGCYLTYAGPAYAPQPAPPPCLQTGHITYGCFNTLSKITPQVVELWSRILHADPRAHLMLKNSTLDDAHSRRLFLDLFEKQGIGAGRIELWGGSPHAGLLAWYANVDIALDPFPYNGGTTTCEALWMGVPVVTLAGDRFVSRVGATLLAHAGLGEWITHTADEYVERALALGADTEILRRIRLLLRDQVRRSPLGDTKAFVRRLEDAYRSAWRRYCASQQQQVEAQRD